MLSGSRLGLNVSMDRPILYSFPLLPRYSILRYTYLNVKLVYFRLYIDGLVFQQTLYQMPGHSIDEQQGDPGMQCFRSFYPNPYNLQNIYIYIFTYQYCKQKTRDHAVMSRLYIISFDFILTFLGLCLFRYPVSRLCNCKTGSFFFGSIIQIGGKYKNTIGQQEVVKGGNLGFDFERETIRVSQFPNLYNPVSFFPPSLPRRLFRSHPLLTLSLALSITSFIYFLSPRIHNTERALQSSLTSELTVTHPIIQVCLLPNIFRHTL